MNALLVSRLAASAGLESAAIALRQCGGSDVVPEPIETRLEAEIAPASSIKVPIAVVLAETSAIGELDLEDEVEIRAANMTPNDLPSPLVPKYRATLRALLHFMLARSDNVATNTLIDFVGRATVDARAVAWGLRATALRRKLSGALPLIDDPEATGRNAFPASDAARLFERIALRPELSVLVPILEAQEWNEKLSTGLEQGDRFAHKTGDTDEVTHDGGILTIAGRDGLERRYAIAVAAPLGSCAEHDARFGAFMRALRPYLAVELSWSPKP